MKYRRGLGFPFVDLKVRPRKPMIPVSSTNLSSIPNELFRENLGFSGVGGVLRLRRI